VAGPTLAIGLARSGYDVTLYEAHERRVQDVGSFFNLSSTGRALLQELGIADRALKPGTVCNGITFRNHKGRDLAFNPEVTTNIMRGELSAALRSAASDEGVDLELDKRLESLTERSDGSWQLTFSDGSRAEAGIVVGCDGVHSQVRGNLHPHAQTATYAGVVGSGGLAELPGQREADGLFHMTFGLRGFFGYQVIRPGQILWFENHYEADERTYAELAALADAEWVGALVDRHRTDPADIGAIIGASVGPVWRWPVYEVPTLTQWHRGTAMVIGDAAHAIQPHLGLGATLALEDAYELTAAMRREPDVVAAFVAFQNTRRDRVAAMMTQARRMGETMISRYWWQRTIRDLVMPMAVRQAVKRSSQGIGYRVRPWPSSNRTAGDDRRPPVDDRLA
jgi:2-polyprenyl-6-methoxyphenol hydroxylase-like FAD-dependent oxidoreductase